VLSALPPEAAGLLVLLALALLPGLLVVRAPWTVVPALSAAFWVLSWWWLPIAGRSRVLQAALALFAILALLRLLPRHTVPPPPDYAGPAPRPLVTGPTTGHTPKLRSAASLTVLGVALGMIVPLPLWPHAPGREMAFHTTSTRLAVWRDGLPASYEPLLPLAPFGAHSPAVPALAADISILSGLDPGRSLAVAGLLSAALLLLAVFALLAARLRPRSASLAALLGMATVPWPGFLALWGEGGAVLALAFGLSAATLLVGHTSRPSAVAAGMLLAAAALAQPLLALVIAVGVALLLGMTGRLSLASGVALVLAAPALLRTVRALSVGEALAVLRSPRPGELADFATGLVLMALAALVAWLLMAHQTRPGVLAAVLLAASAAVLLISVHLSPAAGQIEPSDLRALAVLGEEARPTEAVCAPPGVVDWVPALAGRPAGGFGEEMPRPWVPHLFREEAREGFRRPCRTLDALPLEGRDNL
jgi:hypothetical protein